MPRWRVTWRAVEKQAGGRRLNPSSLRCLRSIRHRQAARMTSLVNAMLPRHIGAEPTGFAVGLNPALDTLQALVRTAQAQLSCRSRCAELWAPTSAAAPAAPPLMLTREGSCRAAASEQARTCF